MTRPISPGSLQVGATNRPILDPNFAAVAAALRAGDGFEIDIGHVTLVGRCRDCASRG